MFYMWDDNDICKPDKRVHEKLDLILNQTDSKFFRKMTQTKSFLNPKIGLKIGPEVP